MTMQQIEEVLDSRVRPLLHSHGGEVRLVGLEDGIVSIELQGACAGCPSADLSTRGMIEEALTEHFPEIRRVELVHTVDPEVLELARKILRHEVTP